MNKKWPLGAFCTKNGATADAKPLMVGYMKKNKNKKTKIVLLEESRVEAEKRKDSMKLK